MWRVCAAHYGWLAGSGRLRLFFCAFSFISYGVRIDPRLSARPIVFAIHSATERESFRDLLCTNFRFLVAGIHPFRSHYDCMRPSSAFGSVCAGRLTANRSSFPSGAVGDSASCHSSG